MAKKNIVFVLCCFHVDVVLETGVIKIIFLCLLQGLLFSDNFIYL